MAAYNKINAFVNDIASKVHNLGSDTLKAELSNTATVATNSVYADISANELANGNGYTTGGGSLTTNSSSQTSGTYKLVLAQFVWTASGSMGPFRYVTLYNNTAASKQLISWWDYGSSITLASGDTFTAGFDTSNGVLQIA